MFLVLEGGEINVKFCNPTAFWEAQCVKMLSLLATTNLLPDTCHYCYKQWDRISYNNT